MPVALRSSTPRSTEAGSVPVKYGLRVDGSTFAPWTTICCALADVAQLKPHRQTTTARRTPTHPRINTIWPKPLFAPTRHATAAPLQCVPPASCRRRRRTRRGCLPARRDGRGRLTAFYNLCSPLQTVIGGAYTISGHRCVGDTQTWSTVR